MPDTLNRKPKRYVTRILSDCDFSGRSNQRIHWVAKWKYKFEMENYNCFMFFADNILDATRTGIAYRLDI